jgi:hypothetical protein
VEEAGICIGPSITGRSGKDFDAGGEAAARKHAKRILARTVTGGQTELIRRFFETALPGSPCGARISKHIKAT